VYIGWIVTGEQKVDATLRCTTILNAHYDSYSFTQTKLILDYFFCSLYPSRTKLRFIRRGLGRSKLSWFEWDELFVLQHLCQRLSKLKSMAPIPVVLPTNSSSTASLPLAGLSKCSVEL